MRLASEALSRLLHLHEVGAVELPDLMFQARVSIVLFQILLRNLELSREDAAAGAEDTSDAVISLTYLASWPLPELIDHEIKSAVGKGRQSLGRNVTIPRPVRALRKFPIVPLNKVEDFSKVCRRLPTFRNVDEWKIQAWLIEGFLHLPIISSMTPKLFTRKESTDLYMEYIPFSLTASNGLAKTHMSAQTLLDLMIISVVIYQTDEFFDAIATSEDVSKLHTVLSLQMDWRDLADLLDANNTPIYQKLSAVLQFVLTHPNIQNASKSAKRQLEFDFIAYLQASIQQIQDNHRFTNQPTANVFLSPPSSYFKWVRTTAAQHGAWEYAYSFMVCLLDNGEDFHVDLQAKYIGQDCVSRICTLARMFNDYGSLARDRKDINVNSMFFPEFSGDSDKSDQELRMELERLATYEKQCFVVSFKELERLCGTEAYICDVVQFFYNVVEFYSDLYRIRDVSNWLKEGVKCSK